MTQIEVTEDAFLGGRVMVRQPKSGYRAGLDAVFLAATAPFHSRQECSVLDVGAGVGTVGLCVAARCPFARVTLLEREPMLAALAGENISLNQWNEHVRVVNLAVGSSADALVNQNVLSESFDYVFANPPYHAEGRGTAAPVALKAASHAMPGSGLDDWVRFMARMAAPNGTATMIHKAEALPAILAAFSGRFGDLRILPLHPREGEPASRVIVQGIKGSRAPMVLLPGFVLHDEGNAFTAGAQLVLRDGAGMPLRW